MMSSTMVTELMAPSGRPKKERYSKHKPKGAKMKKTNDDAFQKMKTYMMDKENVTDRDALLSLLTHGRVSQRVGLYRKAKTSETVSRKKPLAESQSGPCTPNGCHGNPGSPTRCPVSVKLDKRPHSVPFRSCDRLPGQPEPSLPSGDQYSSMDTSPPTVSHGHYDHVPLKAISERLIKGLDTSAVFGRPDYLDTVRTELRKIMKQSNPSRYAELEECLSQRHTKSIIELHPSPPPSPRPLPHPPIDVMPSNTYNNANTCIASTVNITTSDMLKYVDHNTYSDPALMTLDPSLTTSDPTLMTSDPMLHTDPALMIFTDPFPIVPDQQDIDFSTYLADTGNGDFLDTLDANKSESPPDRPKLFPRKMF